MSRGRAGGRRARGRWHALLPAVVLLAGCSDNRREATGDLRTAAAPAPAPFVSAARETSTAKLAYRHDLTIGLAPDRVAPHFAAARDRCLNETAGCTLLTASIRDGSGTRRHVVQATGRGDVGASAHPVSIRSGLADACAGVRPGTARRDWCVTIPG